MLDISLSVMLIEGGIFLVTLYLLNIWLFKPLVSFMEQRESKLKAELEATAENSEEAEKYKKEIASIIGQAKIEASNIKKRAMEEAKLEVSKLIEKEISKIERAKNIFNQELLLERENLNKELEKEAMIIKEMLYKKLKGIA